MEAAEEIELLKKTIKQLKLQISIKNSEIDHLNQILYRLDHQYLMSGIATLEGIIRLIKIEKNILNKPFDYEYLDFMLKSINTIRAGVKNIQYKCPVCNEPNGSCGHCDIENTKADD